jgi:hypothetical protein
MNNNIHDIKEDFEKLDVPLLSKLFVIYESAHKLIFSMPKFERYTLGETIENNILSLFEIIVMACTANKYDKEKCLMRANAKIEVLKLLYRIAMNCKMVEPRLFLEVEKDLQEAGKMTQGWIKYARNLR